MKHTPAWRRYLRFWGADPRADVDAELEFHVALRVDELVAAGMDPQRARQEALRRLGDAAAWKQTLYELNLDRERSARWREWFFAMGNDVRLGIRQIACAPLFSLATIITLGLGIGANAAMFNVAWSVLLRGLPFADADRMVRMFETSANGETAVGPGQYTEWVKRQRAFEAIAAVVNTTFNLGDGRPERVAAAFVTPSFFETRYTPPLHGRYFLPEEETPGRDHVVVLSHALFQQRYGGDASIVGRTIRLNSEPYTVVGVTPPVYMLVRGQELLYVPLALTAQHRASFTDHWLMVFGKLRADASHEAAQRDLERVSREIAQLQPAAMIGRSATVRDFRADLVADYQQQLLVLFGAVAFVLLLSCLNVANLMIARATGRTGELAIRAALGAGKLRIVRQLATETMVLAIAAGLCAWLVAQLTLSLLLRLVPADLPGLQYADNPWLMLVCSISLSVLAGLVLGVLPAVRGTRSLGSLVRSAGRAKVSRRHDPLRGALVIAEVALAVILLCGAGLFLRSARELNRIDYGFDASNLLTIRFNLASERYATPQQITRTYGEILERVRRLRGVESAAASSSPPLSNSAVDVGLFVEGRDFAAGQGPVAHYRVVTPGYLETMGIRLQSGRTLLSSDRANAAPVIVINETLAKRLWPDENAIGKRIGCCSSDSTRVMREVVGIARDVRHFLTQEPVPEMYVPYEQTLPDSWIWFANSLPLVVRSAYHASVVPAIRQVIASVDADVPVYEVLTYDDLVARATATNRFSTVLLSALAILAIALAAIGLYGVLAYFVAQRAPEIGVRVALGAQRRDILGMVLQQGARLTGIGLITGLAIAMLSGRALDTLLYGVGVHDAITYIGVSIVLAAIAGIACYVPGRIAAGMDPLETLRR